MLFLALGAIAFAQRPSLSPERQKLADETLKERLHYAESKDYQPYAKEPRDAAKHAWDLINKKEFKEAIAEADRGLQISKFDVTLLMAKATAYQNLKDEAKAGEYRARWMAVIDSILYNGDGRSPKTAFTVINVDEEYAVAYILGLKVVSQALTADDGKQFDQLTLKHAESGKEITFYFNVDLPLGALHREFAEKAAEAKKK